MALNQSGGVSDTAREAVLKAARELDYVPNLIGKALNRKKCGVLGVIVPTACPPLFPNIVSGINDAAEELGTPIFVSYTRDLSRIEGRTLKMFSHLHVDGLILAASSMGRNQSLIRELVNTGTPLVQVERLAPGLPNDYVGSDNRGAALASTAELLNRGVQRIGFVKGPAEYSVVGERYEGYCQAFQEAGLDPVGSMVTRLPNRSHSWEDLMRHIRAYLTQPDRPEAILWSATYNEDLSRAMRELGLTNHEDVEVILFDGDPYVDYAGQSFTNVVQDSYYVGRKALQILHQRIAEVKKGRKPDHRIELRLPCLTTSLVGSNVDGDSQGRYESETHVE
jgi:LacI family transcriptional regulator